MSVKIKVSGPISSVSYSDKIQNRFRHFHLHYTHTWFSVGRTTNLITIRHSFPSLHANQGPSYSSLEAGGNTAEAVW